MRAAAAVLMFAVLCLIGSSLVWLTTTGATSTTVDGGAAADPGLVLEQLERTVRPAREIDLAARYAGRLDLLDPRLALPSWHRHARDEAVRVYSATKTCPPAPAEVADASLAKAYAWHARTCAAGAEQAAGLLEGPPFMHPSGKSYGALAVARGAGAPGDHRAFHVLELAALDVASLDDDERALASVPAGAWLALTSGDRVALTPSSLLLADHGPLGLSRLRFYPRAAWQAFAERSSLALVPRAPSALCARPASSALCWQTLSPAERHRTALVASTTASAGLAFVASLGLAFAYLRERRRVHADRLHMLRTLTHELRTPVTSLRFDIEPLRAAYDDLPADCHEPLLRISNDIERLHRVLHRSARYMALFEAPGAAREKLAKIRELPSARAMFEELSGEWPEDVTLSAASDDGPVRTDPEWLGVALRNLVENGARHGAPPVSVTWSLARGDLVVRVADAGSTPRLSLRRAVAPHERAANSAGLGLGLAIVARIAQLLGGRLTHERSPTVFQLRVPAQGGGA